MIWQVPKIWENGEVWIIGGGSSIIQQFEIPQKVSQKVLEMKASIETYSPFLSKIHNKHVIGVNAAYLLGDWIDIIFFGDKGFYLSHARGLAGHSAMKVSCNPYLNNINWVKFVQRDNTKVRGLTDNPKKVSWNYNSGAAAINLAVHLGAKKIVLLGFDMKLQNNNQHWHNVYNTSNKKRFHLPFERHLRGFPNIAKDAEKLGVEILNASPDSAITVFKKVNVKDLV